jgi:alkylhydroperoxidase family enzyme
MRTSSPRVAPVADAQLSDYQREVLSPLGASGRMNIFRTMVRSPKALKRFLVWGNYVLYLNSLPPREREIVVLRIGYLCRSGYEWAQHVPIGLEAGLGAEEIERIKRGPGMAGWTAAEAALLRAVDELHETRFVAGEAWSELRRHFTEAQCVDVVFTTTQYAQVSTILNTLGVQLDDGQVLDPDLCAG